MAGLGLAIILGAMLVLMVTHEGGQVAGIEAGDFAQLAAGAALALVFAGYVVHAFRGRFGDGVRALGIWAVLLLGFAAAYTYRDEVEAVAARLTGELVPGTTSTGPGGEVVISRRLDGTYVVGGRIGERASSFIFDTGASTVVLTAETAAAAGFEPRASDYTVAVSTANGRTTAAPVTLDRLSVGAITVRNVRALVARPGVLRQNLLGMTFLDRLASYEVRGNRLTLRGRGAV